MHTLRPGDSLGPWLLVVPIGLGGMGVVWRAVHRETGQPAALKSVHLVAAHSVQALRREVRAMARLSHPGVVAILDEGLDDEIPWYAMALVEGPSLRVWGGLTGTTTRWLTEPGSVDRLDDSARSGDHRGQAPYAEPSRPLRRVQEVLAMGRALCEPLAAVHAAGLVHRDLKPDNVIVTPGDRPVLVDFGLAARFTGPTGREVLDRVSGLASGTLGYVAPEQARGELVDARADLYALGAMLYELLTGRVPFLQGRLDPREPLVAPSVLVPGLPPALDDLIAHLLAFRSSERLGFADDVAHALSDLLAGPAPLAAVAERSQLYRARLHGRAAELDALAQRVDRLADGQGGVVAVVGRSGIGKSRLVLEAARDAASRARVLLGGALPGGRPLEALQRPMAEVVDECRAGGLEATERVLGPRGPVLAPWFPGITSLPGQQDYTVPADLPHRDAVSRLCAAIGLVFEVLDPDPVVLVLDDLHWADALTVELLGYLADLDSQRLLVIASWRSEDETEALRAMRASVDTLTLGALSPEAITGLVADMLALPQPDAALVRAILPRVEGMPLLAAEFVRTAADLGWLHRDPSTGWQVRESERSLPHTLVDLVRLRLDAMHPDALAVLRLAAVVGRDMPEALLERASALDRDAVHTAIRELTRRQVLSELGSGRLCFTHDTLREVVLADLDGTPRAAMHARVAEGLEAEGGDPSTLADHWDAAGRADRAHPWHLEAGLAASRRFAFAAAERHLRTWLAGEPAGAAPNADAVWARLALGDKVLSAVGAGSEARALVESAVALADQLGNPTLHATAMEHLASLLAGQGQLQEALAWALRAEALSATTGDPTLVYTIGTRVAICLHQSGDLDGAEARYRHALANTAPRLHEARAVLLMHLAILDAQRGDLDGAEVLFRESVDASRACDAATHLSRGLVNLGKVYVARGELDGAVQWFSEALPLIHRLGDKRTEAHVLDSLGDVELGRGHLEVARGHFEAAITLSRRVINPRLEAHALCNLSLVEVRVGDLGAARRHLDRALEVARTVGTPDTLGRVHHGLADLHAGTGDLEASRASFAEALEWHLRMGPNAEGEDAARDWARMERRAGHPDRAAQIAHASLARSLDAGNRAGAALAWCELGFVALARGASAEEALTRAHALAARLPAPARQAVDRLAQAQREWELGR